MDDAVKKELSLFDSTCIIVGIIIGVGIYQMAPMVAGGAGGWWGVLAIWALGGLLSLCGALCYAELATAYPREGGDYVYLTKAYGRWAGFLFGWAQLVIIRPGDIAVMAFAFATYARAIYYPFQGADQPGGSLPACAAVILLTIINILGVKSGKWTQNILTVIKGVGLLAIVIAALFSNPPAGRGAPKLGTVGPGMALILVLFTFGGWNEMAYVAAEVKNPRKNILRALVSGTLAVTALYLLANIAFLRTLGYEGLCASNAVASDSISAVLPKIGGQLIAALICISALGVINGLIFTGARISYALGRDYKSFRYLGRWDEQARTPVTAMAVQGLIAVGLIWLFGSFLHTLLYTSAAVYAFYLATSLAVIVLRSKDPDTERPYKLWGYPVTPIIFALVCAALIWSSVSYAWSAPERRLSIYLLTAAILTGIAVYRAGDSKRTR